MAFNSFVFAVFLPCVLVLYWILGRRWQNRMLLVASYLFYGWWDWRFLSLLAISTVVDYTAGLRIAREHNRTDPHAHRRKRLWLMASMFTNLGLLGFFKYFNFFAESLVTALQGAGISIHTATLNVILPVGISFYTFQTMSYTIDIYRGKMEATRHFLDFALFVSFFPQLVAGPIERATVLLPQMLNKRHFDRAQFMDGLHLIFWGLFKKVYVADNLAPCVDRVFAASAASTWEVLGGMYAFAFQIYCDFSGYSDVARGCAKCMGFELRLNFDHPYIATNPREFWQRWHISLSTWLRDYLYIPLGGNRGSSAKTYRNLALTMLLGGLWHGAAWKFVLWGAYQGVLLIVHRLIEVFLPRNWSAGASQTDKKPRGTGLIPPPGNLAARFVMFHLVCIGWLFFRAHSVTQAGQMLLTLCRPQGEFPLELFLSIVQFVGPLLLFELLQRVHDSELIHRAKGIPAWVTCSVFAVYFYLFAFHGAVAQSFIYFQF